MFHQTGPLGDGGTFRAIFFEETQEHIANVEAILLRMDADEPCADDLNAIFRAVHSIKGSAAMLGCTEVAALAHLQENLLDLLRKGERPIEAGDIGAMLKAGDIVRSQVLHRRGLLEQAPDSSRVEALLRECVARPAADAKDAAPGPVTRTFTVKLGPLEQPIDEGELDMMLTGLSEMGAVSGSRIDNVTGGSVRFEVSLQGAASELQSVLSLVVAPELIVIETASAGSAAVIAAVAPPPAEEAPAAAADDADEFFVDPAEFRRRAQVQPVQPADAPVQEVAAESMIDVFVSPEDLKKERRQRPAPETPEPVAQSAHDATFIRVSTEKIDLLVNLVGELVITEAMLARQGAVGETEADGHYGGNTGLADLARHTRNLQEAVLAIRMLPISNVFSRFPRLVHELSARLGKRVELKLSGESTELDRGLIEKISDPLTHLVRNAIDHGLEPPQARIASGKSPVGVVNLRASQRGGNIVIEVSDDGRGLDRERILARAAERRIPIAPDAPDVEVWQLVFEAGFSTAEKVTDVSGRGVGMDVVRRNIQALGGTVDLSSTRGRGMKVTVSVPLTLAIMDAMTVSVGGETYVLPLSSVVESRSVSAADIHTLPEHGDTLRVRDEYLPVLQLAKLFPPQQRRGQPDGIAVIVETDGSNAAVLVDELVGQQQVVVKSLETNFRKVPGLSGATVMGDGSVALILDVGHLLRLAGREDAMLL
jgi:two-component system chemotaxis sensor kinase CheA